MTIKEGIFLVAFFLIIISFRNYYVSVATGELVLPRYPSVSRTENLHSMKKMRRGVQEMEICIGRRCQRRSENDHSNKAGNFVCLAIVSLIGLFAVMKIHKQSPTTCPERNCAHRFGRVMHSTGIRCDCSSLSPSPIPSSLHRLSPQPVRSVSNYFEDNLVWFEDLQDVSPLPTSPPKLENCYSGSSSSSGIFPIVPPRRWRGNSKLDLAQSPEVLPNAKKIPSFQLNNVSI